MKNVILISHSEELAKATSNFITEMIPTNENVKLSYVGGNDDGNFGNSYSKISKKLKECDLKKELAILFCDLGSAFTITKLVIEQEKLNSHNIKIANAPFLEGSFEVYASWTHDSIDEILKRCEKNFKKQI